MRVFSMENDLLEGDFSYHLEEKKAIQEKLKNKSDIQIDDIRRIALWKYDRVIDVDDSFCTQLYHTVSKENISIEDSEVQAVIERLKSEVL